MNCREAQRHILAEEGSAVDRTPDSRLNAHVRDCGACRRMRDDLAAALSYWRTDASATAVPDAEIEWQKVRRQIRGGAESLGRPPRQGRPAYASWIAFPLLAGAAAVLTFFLFPGTPEIAPSPRRAPQTARADAVEAPGNNASTMVFVDDKNGWLFVWASDATPKRG